MRLLVLLSLCMIGACGDKDSGQDGHGGSDTGGGMATDGGSSGDGGAEDGGAEDGGAGDGGAGDGGAGDGGGADPEAPTVTAVDAWCYLHSTGDKDYIWSVQASYTDPQGDDSAASFFDGVTVFDGTTELATYALVCGDPGDCFGTFRESDDNVRCSLASGYTVQVRVLDEDDNWSAPVSTTGRLCPSSEPC